MKRILIIEDDSVMGNIYRTCLEKDGYEAEVAGDGQSGFYRVHEFHPDGILLDLMLPKLNGVDILKKIRAQAQFQSIPIVVFTNAYVANMIQEALSAGATQVFNKATLTPRQIIDALHNAIHGLAGPPAVEPVSPPDAGEAQPSSPGDARRQLNLGEVACRSHALSSKAAMDALASASGALGVEGEFDSAPDTDTEFQAELLQSFIDTAPDTLAALRKNVHEFTKTQPAANRLAQLLELYRKVHALTGSAGVAGLHQLSRLTAALEVLLKELHDKPKNLNASTLRTVANSIDFVGEIFQKGLDPGWSPGSPSNIMVVDDEVLSRRAILYALEKAGLKATGVEDPQTALELAMENVFDLIFLDVLMPGMDGFDLCTKIHALHTNPNTPVIFVTSLSDFKSRARSSLSGGADLIAKPFMFIELSVKALTYLLRGELVKHCEQRRAA